MNSDDTPRPGQGPSARAPALGGPNGGWMEWLVKSFQLYPELAIFLTLALGYWFGNLKVATFSLGSVTGVLLAGVLVSRPALLDLLMPWGDET